MDRFAAAFLYSGMNRYALSCLLKKMVIFFLKTVVFRAKHDRVLKKRGGVGRKSFVQDNSPPILH